MSNSTCEAQQAEAWRAVIDALLEHNPSTLNGTNMTGIELAVAEIKRLQSYDNGTQPVRMTDEKLEQAWSTWS